MNALVPVRSSRKAEALAYITEHLRTKGHSPSMQDIADALGVGKTRAKTLVHQLATQNMIKRAPGSQRAISVPGLFDQLVAEKLRSEGWIVDEDLTEGRATGPQGHLSLIAILDHVPPVEALGGEVHDHGNDGIA
jgi:SOS-response transcriptional repressor LexA